MIEKEAPACGLAYCMSMFLTATEIRELTGYRKPTYQKRWLIERRWLFEENRAGQPMVLREHLHSHLNKPAAATRKSSLAGATTPNWNKVK